MEEDELLEGEEGEDNLLSGTGGTEENGGEEDDSDRPVTRKDLNDLKALLQAAVPTKPAAAPAAEVKTTYNPDYDARRAVRLENKMLNEVKDLYPNLPPEVEEEIIEFLGRAKTLEDLDVLKNAGIHTQIADAAMGRRYREGKSVAGKPALKLASSRSESPASASSRLHQEADEIGAALGVEIDKSDRERIMKKRQTA